MPRIELVVFVREGIVDADSRLQERLSECEDLVGLASIGVSIDATEERFE